MRHAPARHPSCRPSRSGRGGDPEQQDWSADADRKGCGKAADRARASVVRIRTARTGSDPSTTCSTSTTGGIPCITACKTSDMRGGRGGCHEALNPSSRAGGSRPPCHCRSDATLLRFISAALGEVRKQTLSFFASAQDLALQIRTVSECKLGSMQATASTPSPRAPLPGAARLQRPGGV